MSTNTPIAGLPSPELTDSPNIETAVGSLASAVDSLLVPRYSTVAARDAAITAPVFGQLASVSATSELYMYNGTIWISAKPRYFFKGSSQTVSASTVLVDDVDIQIPMEANGKYLVRLVLACQHSSTGDIKLAWTDPGLLGGGGSWRISWGSTADGTASASAAYSAVSSAYRSYSTTTSATHDLTTSHSTPVFEEFYAAMGAVTGTMKLQWAQNSAAGTTTVLAGSWATVVKIG